LIGRPADGGTKPLRKYESVPRCRFPDRRSGAPIGKLGIALSGNSVESAGYFQEVLLVYQALTAIRKDCGHFGKKHRR
jgi:hypothetical protein